MRLLVLFYRSRRTLEAIALLIAVSLGIIIAGVMMGRSEQVWIPLALAAPLAMVSLVIITGIPTMSELEAVASQAIWRFRGARLGLLTLVCGCCLVALAIGWPVEAATIVILRAFAILLGIGLTAATIVGASHAWWVPALVVALGLINQRVMDVFFPTDPQDLGTIVVAALILLAGLLVGSVVGTPDERAGG